MHFLDRILRGMLLVCTQKPSIERSLVLFQVYLEKDEAPHPHEVACG